MAKKKGKSKQSSSKRTVNRPPENEIRASFRFAQKQIAERSFKDPKLKASLDLDSARTYRRIKAAEAYAEEVAQRVTRLYPDTAEYDWANDWAQVSSYPRSGYDAVEEVKTVTMAIAIWILDQLRESCPHSIAGLL